MKSCIHFIAAAILLLCSCGRPQPAPQTEDRAFADDVRLRTTPVKNQGRSQLC